MPRHSVYAAVERGTFRIVVIFDGGKFSSTRSLEDSDQPLNSGGEIIRCSITPTAIEVYRQTLFECRSPCVSRWQSHSSEQERLQRGWRACSIRWNKRDQKCTEGF